MATLAAILVLGAAMIIQISFIRQITLLHGTADLVLIALLTWMLHENTEHHWQWSVVAGLLVGFASHLPVWLTILSYFLVMFILRVLLLRIWQAPLLVLFLMTIVGSLVIMWLDYLYLVIFGAQLPFWDTFNLVILPSMVLNLILALPIYALMGELARSLYPPVIEA
jgi:hypothetical protein